MRRRKSNKIEMKFCKKAMYDPTRGTNFESLPSYSKVSRPLSCRLPLKAETWIAQETWELMKSRDG